MKTNLEAMDAAEQARQVWAQFAPAILEDWFAGLALREILRIEGRKLDPATFRTAAQCAGHSYDLAQAMTAERQRRKDLALARAVAEAKKR